MSDLTNCPRCGKNNWKWIPDSLAQHCECGFVRVQRMDGSWEPGASIQEWAADLAKARKPAEQDRIAALTAELDKMRKELNEYTIGLRDARNELKRYKTHPVLADPREVVKATGMIQWNRELKDKLERAQAAMLAAKDALEEVQLHHRARFSGTTEDQVKAAIAQIDKELNNEPPR
jgi:signal transduction protein with GAF and PtsI domain